MWNDTEDLTIRRTRCTRHPRRLGWTAPAALLGVLLSALVAVPLVAQEQAAAVSQEQASTAGQPADAELAARVTAAYDVLPVQGGVLLRPLQEYRGVRAIEVAGDSVAINGEAVPDEAVRGWLGARADDVLALAAMDPDERQSLLAFDGPATGAPAAPQETGKATGESSGEVGVTAETAAVEPSPVPPRTIEPPPAPPARPEARSDTRSRRGSQTGFGSNVYVAPDEVVDDVVVLGGSVTVDGRVDGDAVVVGGRLEVNGTVDQNAAVIGGSMVLGPRSDIGGDVSVVGGSLHRDPGAHIGGKIEQVERGWHLAPLLSHGQLNWSPAGRVARLVAVERDRRAILGARHPGAVRAVDRHRDRGRPAGVSRPSATGSAVSRSRPGWSACWSPCSGCRCSSSSRPCW